LLLLLCQSTIALTHTTIIHYWDLLVCGFLATG
jgi:hypothetical protein